MKKIISLVLCLVLATMLVACGSESKTGAGGNSSPTVNDVLESRKAAAESDSESTRKSGVSDGAPEPESTASTPLSTTEGIDIDLTSLSSTMVYSEVYNMMTVPSDYIGKVVKMNGIFSTFHDDNTGKNYFACVIKDATACCSQGIEFVLTDDYSYPDDYPSNGDTVTVVGTFNTYTENNYSYCTLLDANLV